MSPRILLLLIVLLIAGAYGLGVYALLNTKTQVDKVNESVATLNKSVSALASDVGEVTMQASRAYGIASTAAPKNLSSMDMMEFRSLHPDLKNIYRSAFAGTIMPAVGAAANRMWTAMTPAQRARIQAMSQTAATMVAAELNRLSQRLPANPTASDLRMLDRELDALEARMRRGYMRPPMVLKPSRTVQTMPRPPMVIAAPKTVTAAPVPR